MSQTGVQLLTAFLLSLPLQQRFTELSTVQLIITFKPIWTRTSASGFTSINIPGHVAYVGRTNGYMYGYDTRAGAQVWSADIASTVGGPAAGYFGSSGVNIGDGVMAVPTETGLVVYGD